MEKYCTIAFWRCLSFNPGWFSISFVVLCVPRLGVKGNWESTFCRWSVYVQTSPISFVARRHWIPDKAAETRTWLATGLCRKGTFQRAIKEILDICEKAMFKKFCFNFSLFTQLYKWVVTIYSARCSNTSGCFKLRNRAYNRPWYDGPSSWLVFA